MKILPLSLFLALSFVTVRSQNSELTLRDAVLKQYKELNPRQLTQLKWVPGSDRLSHVVKENELETLVFQTSTSQEHIPVLSISELNNLLPEKERSEAFPSYDWLDENTLFINREQQYYAIDITKKEARLLFTLPEDAAHITFNKQKTACSYILDHNLHILKVDHTNIRVSSDGKPGIVYGQSVHRNEFGIEEGMFWSPDGSKLAFYRMDETMVDDYPLVDVSSTPASLKSIKYPMAGRTSHYVQVGVYDISGVPTVYMNTEGPKDQYLTSVGWTADSKSVIIGLLNRDQNHLKLGRYNARSGFIEKPLLEEKDDKYVEPEHAPWFIPGRDQEFLWFSERDGYQHLYLYDTEGNMKKQVTTGKWEVHKIIGLDNTGNFLFVEGTGETITDGFKVSEERNGMHRFIYVVDLALHGHTLLDSTLGTHWATLSGDGTHLIHYFSSTTTPLVTDVYAATGKKLNTLLVSEDPLHDYRIGKAELVEVPAGDGSTLYGRLVKPSHFDPAKKYPVLLYVYGGPHAQLVRDIYLASAPGWMYWFAEKGYIVATVDNRGSSNRGLAFEQSTFRKLGEVEMTDQKTFVDYLQGLPYVDKNRFGIHGWSYGGFMTINMMLTFPGTFKAGAAGGPVCDWKFYEVMYTERYMDTPATNAGGYEATSLINRAKNLDDDLLVIHGTADDVVVWQHSQAFVKACIEEGIQLDYFIYPGHPHNVHGPDRVHLMEKVLTYIDERIGQQQAN